MLFLVLEKVTPDKAVDAMSKYGGTVLKTSLSKKLKTSLSKKTRRSSRKPCTAGARRPASSQMSTHRNRAIGGDLARAAGWRPTGRVSGAGV
jgi:hypothetical protein